MDTREKIVPLERIREDLAAGEWVVVVGLFDPLTAIQAERISVLRNGKQGKLAAIVLNAGQTLLASEARAALMAGLRDVDAVAIATPDAWRNAIPERAGVRVVEDLAGEETRSADFVQFVLQRQQSAAMAARRGE